jgi:5-dehydro-2-deoxygluconokinase
VLKALEYARRHGLRTALDIDYRPVLWGFTSLGDGETRFIESGPVTSQLQEVLHLFDLVVGTEEEFHIAGGSTDTLTALKNVRNATKATLVCKRGPMGCVVLEGDIPDSWDRCRCSRACAWRFSTCWAPGMPLCPAAARLAQRRRLGAGLPLRQRLRRAGGLRHGCAPAMPTKVELDDYLLRAESVPRPDIDARLNHLHRVTSRRQQWPELCIFAFDHRKQLADLAGKPGAIRPAFRSSSCCCWPPPKRPRRRRVSISAAAFSPTAPTASALNAITGKGWWIGRPIELPGSRPLRLEHGNIGSQLIDWPLEHVVKCLVFYHPATRRRCVQSRMPCCWKSGRPATSPAMSCCWR